MPDLVFVQRCRVCDKEIQTPWGPEVHEQSRQAVREHVLAHSNSALLTYAVQEALRGT